MMQKEEDMLRKSIAWQIIVHARRHYQGSEAMLQEIARRVAEDRWDTDGTPSPK